MTPSKRNIKTFVVFDTETTGLMSPGNKPRITELCLFAVTRDEIKTKLCKEPRVLNKLILCFNPCKSVQFKSSELTGLHSDSLACQATLKDQADIVISFLQNLPQPACLLAHNGNRFDFPLLMVELKRINKRLSCDILCADTLEAFRVLDGLPPVADFILEKEKQQKLLKATKVPQTCTPLPVPGLSLQNNVDAKQVLVRDEDEIQMPSPCRKRRTENLNTESDVRNVKEKKVEFESLQQNNETTPERKPIECAQPVHKELQVSDFPGVDNVRKHLFTVPNSDETDEARAVSVSDVDRISSNKKSGGECSLNLVCDSGETGVNLTLLSQQSITESEVDLVEACEQAEILLPQVKNCKTENVSSSQIKDEPMVENVNNDKTKEGCIELTKPVCGQCVEKKVDLPGNKTRTSNGTGKKSYALGNLYLHYFGQSPEVVHTAEDDCKILLKLILLNLDKFIRYCDDNAMPFSDVEPMY